jgi:glutamyl/glutaminyl-tRNA synthetase
MKKGNENRQSRRAAALAERFVVMSDDGSCYICFCQPLMPLTP